MTSNEAPEGTEGSTERGQQVNLRVVSGNPKPEELAAVIAVISAAASAADVEVVEPKPAPWSAPSSMHRPAMPAPGPGVWAQLGRHR